MKTNSHASLVTAKIATSLAALLLIATTGGNLWLYFKGIQALRLQSQSAPSAGAAIYRARTEEAVSSLFVQMDGWFHSLSISTLVGAAGFILVVGMFFSLWRQTWIQRLVRNARKLEQLRSEMEQTHQELSRYQIERSGHDNELRQAYADMERQIQDRTATLARNCASLEKELNSRRQAEMALTFQAKELERSKDVLELHVQARTKELQKLKSRYELILNSAGEGIYGLDLQGRTTFINPAAAKLTGRDINQMLGKPEHEIFYGLPHPPSMDEDAIKKDQDGHHLSEQIFQRQDGTTFPVEYIRTSITENDRLFGAVIIFKDITERKSTEDALARKAAELSRSNAELEQFAYVASHDLQEPLRKIQAFGDRLNRKCQAVDLKEGRDYLDRMLGAAARMQVLINDLLTFSRVISTSQAFVPIDLTTVAREVLGDLEVRIEQTKAQINLGELPTIDADPTQMRQLLQNLISNALKFNKPDHPPQVSIAAEVKSISKTTEDGIVEEKLCELRIQDQGIGFEEKYIEKIFAVFQRLHGRSEYEGTGVGLAVCRRILERHHGTITAQSQPDQGATFIVTLPFKQSRKKSDS